MFFLKRLPVYADVGVRPLLVLISMLIFQYLFLFIIVSVTLRNFKNKYKLYKLLKIIEINYFKLVKYL